MLRRKKYYVIYPEYFDKEISRKQGRRVPAELSTTECTLKKVEHACKNLKYEYVSEKDKAFPNQFWEKRGRVLIKIDKKEKTPKQKIVRDIAEITRKLKTKTKEKEKKAERSTKSNYQKKTTHSRKKSSYQTSTKKKKDKKATHSRKKASDQTSTKKE